MHLLRRSTLLARLVLAWFVLAVGVAVASPMVQPQAMELVCSASGGVKLIPLGSAGEQDAAAVHHTLDCPMCLAATLPPAPHRADCAPPQPLAHALRPAVAAHIAALAGAPLPPRGPPSLA
ncbi:DUF2946 family protein [Pseudorhodoferax sp. Leaf274]|uniref:DUF2946 family protein n=1 Tax=Pseudorhodoferax sp. Leaf274 TaxID=1736318 RepID=UPI000702B813|nr:DUF2946 family protein [Pseudorhodoferax sp. Leaf274]KQP43703.1 hypothetical protein ASF44_29500 [Pseudorhodoferax sp. Leaf274]